MLGDKRKFPDHAGGAQLRRRSRPGRRSQRLPAADDRSACCALPEVHAKMEREVRKTLRDLAQFEMPKQLLLLPADFSVETGELTPTLKVKAAGGGGAPLCGQIESLYAESHTS